MMRKKRTLAQIRVWGVIHDIAIGLLMLIGIPASLWYWWPWR